MAGVWSLPMVDCRNASGVEQKELEGVTTIIDLSSDRISNVIKLVRDKVHYSW